MRIIAGKYKRSNLLTLESKDTRPTKDMVKEALFSSIDVIDKTILDLFSGSGAIGIEALSRGAKYAIFNDYNPKAYKIIKDNLKKLKVDEDFKIFNLDFKRCIEELRGNSFDYIFLDPPYVFKDYQPLMDLLDENGLINKMTTIIWEIERSSNFNISNYSIFKEKCYGISKLIYLKKENQND